MTDLHFRLPSAETFRYFVATTALINGLNTNTTSLIDLSTYKHDAKKVWDTQNTNF